MLLSSLRDRVQPPNAAPGKSHVEAAFHDAHVPKTLPEKQPGLELPAEPLNLIVQGRSRKVWALSMRSCRGSQVLLTTLLNQVHMPQCPPLSNLHTPFVLSLSVKMEHLRVTRHRPRLLPPPRGIASCYGHRNPP